MLQLQFFAALRGPSWIKVLMLQLPFSAPLRVLRGQKMLQLQFFAVLRCPSWIKVLMLQLPFFVVQKKVFTSRFPMI